MPVSDAGQKQVHQPIDRFDLSTLTRSPEFFSQLHNEPEKSTAQDFTVGELYGCICHRSTRDFSNIAAAGEFT
jgi:hypothetical protein